MAPPKKDPLPDPSVTNLGDHRHRVVREKKPWTEKQWAAAAGAGWGGMAGLLAGALLGIWLTLGTRAGLMLQDNVNRVLDAQASKSIVETWSGQKDYPEATPMAPDRK